MVFNDLNRVIGKSWLKNNPNHLYNQWLMKSDDCKEKILLHNLDSNLKEINGLRTKRLQRKLRNEFVDTYYELEIGCHLLNQGFEIDFEKTLKLDNGNKREPDVFVKTENAIIEIKTLHQSFDLKKGKESGKVFKIKEADRIKDRILKELGKYSGSGIKYPLVVMLCNDYLIKPTILSPDDLETVLLYRSDRIIVSGSDCFPTSDVEYKGLYYANNGRQAELLSGVGLWRKNPIRFYENPNVNRYGKIPRGKLLDLLRNF